MKLEGAMLPNRFVFPPWAFKALLDKLTPVLTQTQAKATRTRVVSAATPASGADTPGRSGGAAGTDARHDAADAIDAPALPFKEAV